MKQNRSIQRIRTSLTSNLLHKILVLCTGLMCMLPMQAQDLAYELEGTVIDAASGRPLPAVQIKAMSSSVSATTNADGKFTISLESKTDVLVVKAFDFNIVEVPVRGRTSITIKLNSDEFSPLFTSVEDVKSTKSSSHTAASISHITEMGNETSQTFENQLQGMQGGALRSITRSGLTGIGNVMFLRGNNTLISEAQPLIVVDGIVWNRSDDVVSIHSGYKSNPLGDLAPSDIAKVTVIKDAVSIYGAKGANGVILIETKRGEDMATKIELNATMGLFQPASSLPMMDVDQFRIYTTDLIGGMTDELVNEFFGESADRIDFLNDSKTKNTYNMYHNNTDWDKEVYRSGFYQKYNVSVNGGDDKALYHFSVGYTGTDEVVNEVGLQQLHTRFNSDINLFDFLDLAINIGFNNTNRDMVDDGDAFTSPSYQAMIKAPFLSPYEYSQLGDLTSKVDDADVFGTSNPTALLRYTINRSKHYRFNVGATPKFYINKNFTFTNHFDYNLMTDLESNYIPKIGVADRYIPGYGISENARKNQSIYNVGLFNDAVLSYANAFDKHRINALVGVRYIQNLLEVDYVEGHNTGTDESVRLADELDFKQTSGVYDFRKSQSNYINVDYNYDYRYFLTLAASMDASSNFGTETDGGLSLLGRSWGIFPSLQAAWLASSETFMSNVDVVNNFKLRASVGLSGNDDINPYAWTAYFSSVRYMGDANGLILGNYGNEKLQWETSLKTNIGLDANVFNNRIALSVDAYKNYISNLLHYENIPELMGVGTYQVNGGEMTNTGFDLSATAKVLNTSALKWEFGASIGHYTNEVTALPDGDIITDVYKAKVLTTEGEAASVFYGYKTDGVFATAVEATEAGLYMYDDNAERHEFAAGDMKFVDKNGDGEINETDMQIIGDPNPDFFGSFNTTFAYGDFSLNALFTFSYGNEAYNYLRYTLESGSSFNNQSEAMLSRWSYEGQITEIPKVTYLDPMGNARFSDRWIEDASFLKFKTLSLNYTLPISTMAFDKIEVWIAANNLFTWTNYLGRDPEFSINNKVMSQGIDMGLMPQTTSYFVGLKINL